MEFRELEPSVQQSLPDPCSISRSAMPTMADPQSKMVEAADAAQSEPNKSEGVNENDSNEENKDEEDGSDDSKGSAIIYRNAQMLSQQDWNNIVAANKLLHGYQIRVDVPDVVRARRAAEAFTVRNPRNIPDGVMPSFQVVDGSSIQIIETQNAWQSSLAHNAFSKKSIDTDLCAGDMGIQGGFLGGRGREHTEGVNDGLTSQDGEYYATYNFPRARVFLDEYELAISPDCRDLLKRVEKNKDQKSLQEFETKYGHVFVTSVVLGGQQRTEKSKEAIEFKSNAQKQDAVRGAIGAKIIAPYVSGSFKYSKDRGSDSASQEDHYADVAYMGMSACGGDTLIGADVPNWIKTVASPHNWRVIGNETVVPIALLISLVTHKPWIPGLFRAIREERHAELGKDKPQLPRSESDELKKWIAEGRP